MKNAIILHGTGCNPNSYWIPSIQNFLEKRGYEVWVPQLPKPDTPDLTIQLPFILTEGRFAHETILIGHSAGGPLVLSTLEKITTKIDKAILVAGYARPRGTEKKAELILQKKYDWKKIQSHVNNLIFINSDNDPWYCNDKEGKYMFNHLGGIQVIVHGEGHFGSDTFKQPYKSFPLLQSLLW